MFGETFHQHRSIRSRWDQQANECLGGQMLFQPRRGDS